jgi:hypothetical protein
MATVQERFQEKLRARAEGRAPVVVQLPEPSASDTPGAVDARFRAKMARHGKPDPESKPEEGKGEKPAKTEKAAEGGKSEKPDKKPESKPEEGKGEKPPQR